MAEWRGLRGTDGRIPACPEIVVANAIGLVL